MDNLNKTKMMKKILMLLLQLVLITVCFCGCRDDQPSDQPSEPVLSASVDGVQKSFLVEPVIENGKMLASSGDPRSKIIHMEFRRKGVVTASLDKMIELTEEEKTTGVVVRKLPSTSLTYKISFENEYGIWTHTIIQIFE